MIFLFRNGPGRLGNHLFNLFFILALSKKYKQNIFLLKTNYLLKYFDLKKEFFKDQSILKPIQQISYKSLSKPLNYKFNYVLKPPILGSYFFDFYKDNIDFTIKNKYNSNRINTNMFNVAIHFRGTDFVQWDKKSILSSTYYLNSIKYILKQNKKVLFYLYYDDDSLKSFKEVLKFLKTNNKKFELGNSNKLFMYDLSEMSQCNSIISSPSTFCIWASFLGYPKKDIFHSKDWIRYQLQKNDKFWIDLTQNGKSCYNKFILI